MGRLGRLFLRHYLMVFGVGGCAMWIAGLYDPGRRLTYPTLFFLILVTFLAFYQLFTYLRDPHPSWIKQLDQAVGVGVSMRLMIETLGGFQSPFYPVLYLAMAFASALFSVRVALAVAGLVVVSEHLHAWLHGVWTTRFPPELLNQVLLGAFAFLPGFFLNHERRERMRALIQLRSYEKDAAYFDFARYADMVDGRVSTRELSRSQLERDLVSILHHTRPPLDEITALLFERLKAHTVAVYLVDNGGRSAWLRSSRSHGEALDVCHPIAVRDSLFAWPFSQKKKFYIPQVKSPEVLQYYTEPPDVKSLVCFPITHGEWVEGFLLIDFLREEGLTGSSESLLEMAVAATGQAISSMKTLQRIHQEGIVFAAFNRASREISSSLNLREISKAVGEVVRQILECDVVALAICETMPEQIAIYEPLGLRVVRARTRTASGVEEDPIILRPGEGPIGWTIDHKEPFPKLTVEETMPLLGDHKLLREVQSFVCLPLSLKEACHGAMLVGSYEADHFGARELHLLRTIVHQAALAVSHAMAYREKERQSLTDGLTNLYNRRFFMEALDREIDRVERFPQDFTVLIMDLDHFKKINDTYGHPAGDLVLRKVARQLKRISRRIDTVARYGGEEFGAILVNTGEKEGLKFAERVRRDVADLSFPVAELGVTGKELVKLTASLGLATYPQDGRSGKELVDHADKALYYAKNTGRDRVSIFSKVKNLIPG